MSSFRILAACALLAATAARAEAPPTVEASPRFVDLRARFGLGLGVGGGGPLLSATAVFAPHVAVDLSGFYFPWTPMGGPAAFGALQAGPNFRFDSRNAEGAGNTTDLRVLAGADVTTAMLDSLPPRTVYIPGFICSAAAEWTHWFGSSLGVSGELAATGGISFPGAAGYLRASVGVAF